MNKDKNWTKEDVTNLSHTFFNLIKEHNKKPSACV